MSNELFDQRHGFHEANQDIRHLADRLSSRSTSPHNTYREDSGLRDIQLYNNAYKAQRSRERNQDLTLRDRIEHSVFHGLGFQEDLRKFLAWFYIIYISIVTILIFWVVIDPVALCRHTQSYYSGSIKRMLVGAFFANVLSILIIMCKFSFAPIKDMVSQFKKIGGKHWDR